jgi:hypothetical protein
MVPASFGPIIVQKEPSKGFFNLLLNKSKNLSRRGAIIFLIGFIVYCIFEICQNKPQPPSRKKRFQNLTIRTDEPFLSIPGGPTSCQGRWINPILFNRDNTVRKKIWGQRFVGDH